MFCYQCEQSFRGTGCVDKGVCGKDPDTAALQDLLVYAVRGISRFAYQAAKLGKSDPQIDHFVVEALFTTVTNVNFDPIRLEGQLREAATIRDKAKALYEQACQETGKDPDFMDGACEWEPAKDLQGLIFQGQLYGIPSRQAIFGDTTAGLQELLLYGIKGAAAYAEHARVLGREDPELYQGFTAALDYLEGDEPTVDGLLGWCLKAGELNYRAMQLLDAAHTETYGHPEPTPVRIEPIKGKAILVSGHDLKDLELILKQTEGKGINIYTHGEMLPAHGYPKLKAYKHLVGNYGGAWQDQAREFKAFPGAILMTTNCIQEPDSLYMSRIFTSGLVAWPGVQHISDGDFTPVIEAALAQPGYTEDGSDKTILVGFGRQAVLSVADKVVEAVKSGALKHFFLIGGCDGAKPGRNYYTTLAESVPSDSVVLTLACGKFRFNKKEFGDIGGIPRLLDIGQCNDAYSAIQIALALADAFECGVNDLPLSLVLSWYEQKAVAILLTLLHLGVTNIKLGPSLPAFVTPPVLEVLVEKFGLAPVTTPKADLEEILAR